MTRSTAPTVGAPAPRSTHPVETARSLVPGAVVAAVWPERDGVMVRMERDDQPPRWIVVRDQLVESWSFPDDPHLPGLARAWASARFSLVGHRWGRRAALREKSVPGRFLHLRRPGMAAAQVERLHGLGHLLDRVGVRTPRGVLLASEFDGWWVDAIPGRPLAVGDLEEATARALGVCLARVHAVDPPAELGSGDLRAGRRAAERQIAPVLASGSSLAAWFSASIAADPFTEGLSPQRATLIHGDVHAAQFLVTPEGIALVDWDLARRGEPEEDLGNLAAHLYWDLGRSGHAHWRVIAEAYRNAGGAIEAERFSRYARWALLRVLAIHSWRDATRPRFADMRPWSLWPSECETWSAAL